MSTKINQKKSCENFIDVEKKGKKLMLKILLSMCIYSNNANDATEISPIKLAS